jgi:hypothetical protein
VKSLSDPGGQHARIYARVTKSPAWRALSFAAAALYLDLRTTVTSTNNGNISATLSVLKHKGRWTSPTTLSKALYELRSLGFIAVTIEGGLRQGTRVPSLYRFTDLDVYDQPKVGVLAIKATHEYERFKSAREAEQSLVEGVEKLKEAGKKKQQTKKKPRVQNVYRIATESVLECSFSST